MVKRRQVLFGLGAAAASGFAVSTGAFTSTEMERTVDVTVAEEVEAYLGLDPNSGGPNDSFADTGASGEGNQIQLDFNSLSGQGEGDGVNENADFTFDNVFHVNNQGTQEVEVTITTLDSGDFNDADMVVEFYADGDPEDPIDEDGVDIGAGDTAEIGVSIETGDDVDEFDPTGDVTVHAEATDNGTGG